jgi:hypothetical protein
MQEIETNNQKEIKALTKLTHRRRSKFVLAITEIIGFTGADRLYLGCYSSGTVKMLLFLIFVTLFITLYTKAQNNRKNQITPEIAFNDPLYLTLTSTFVVLSFWSLVDLLDVCFNILSNSHVPVFCFGYAWSTPTKIGAYFMAFALLILYVVLFVYNGIWLSNAVQE